MSSPGKQRSLTLSDKLKAFGRASEAAGKMGALRGRAEAMMAVQSSALDADPFRLNVLNGTLEIRQRDDGANYVELRPHDPDDLITRIAPVTYDPKAECPTYEAFLSRVQPSSDNRRFLHQWGGLCLTGDVSHQVLLFNWGNGKNGKSTLFETWARIIGDYARTVPIETFLDNGRPRNASQPTPDLANLAGVRFLRTSEPEKGAKLAEALIKLATGGEPMLVRHLNRDPFELRPQFKLTMSGNHRPRIDGADEGIWRRVKMLPWTVQIPDAERDLKLTEKLHAEASGILNRLLDGLCDLMDNGICEPSDVTTATAEYRSESDPLGRFMSTCTAHASGERVQSSVLYDLFIAWAEANGAPPWKQAGFSRALSERGYKRKQSDVVWWLDIRTVRRIADFIDQDGKALKRNADEWDGDDARATSG
ncbi:MAG: phage/plasmid primase, P4 family [Pseudomonadota bacterium]|nr:phage/plasmid primase, P4 family [Pseudomonadota bacterium]